MALLPLTWLIWDAGTGNLGANPVEALTHRTGQWGLRFLLIGLAITPLRILTGYGRLLRFRRMLGLYAFFYASLHFLIYLILDRELEFNTIVEDIAERPYITIGFTALMLMMPLAVTSNRALMRRMGRRWQQLHRLVYVVGVCAIVHFLWLVKADLRAPLVYASVLATLLAVRVWHAHWGKAPRRATAKA